MRWGSHSPVLVLPEVTSQGGYLLSPKCPRLEPQLGLGCPVGRHNLIEALRKDKANLGKPRGACGSGGGSTTSPHSCTGGCQDRYLPRRGPVPGREGCKMRETLSLEGVETQGLPLSRPQILGRLGG